ncbi:D-alanyl-D-alanine carboxypeptidase (penicillin-binding protein 5/6) [Alicyclobacillus macrosporangiidus]|uniref:serine-type D-Ala-D-Ala carboxypeptidase n=1 Tax=Alicyclobacillus macrosporangiidus TaxID=392015 RepID=A0A1I7KMI4_9BACL|nr:D-alanyl-D-alanine carboxypeptidase (penicillin-binding protein 5/6) [Alicyclobacillus macrosporangiidus]
MALLCCLMSGTAGAQSIPAAVGGTLSAAGHGPAAAASVEIRPVREVQPDAQEDGTDLAHESRAAVVMDYATGKVLFEKDAHEKLPMASITKVMTLLLVAEAIDSGRLRLTDSVKTSEYAASMGGSQIFLEPGETMKVEDLVKGIAIASANDACVALAEHLAGSEEAFVRQMNRRARELGMDDTHFANCNGLPEPDHYSSAHDIAIMSRELLKHEWITKYTSVYSDYLRKDTEHPFWLVNTNKLVRFYPGVDGLKTGYTAEAKYCLTATAKKDGFRVIAVVMGAPKPSVRNREVSELLNWSFSTFTSQVLYKAGQQVATVHVLHGTPETIPVVTSDTVGVIHRRGEHPSLQTQMAIDDLEAPVRPRQVVGELKVVDGEDVVGSCHLVAGSGARRAGLWETFGRTVRGMVTFGR